MNLLVILSALLTALTGAITGVRPIQAAQQEQVAARQTVRAVPRRPASAAIPLRSWRGVARGIAAADRPLLFTASIPPLGQRIRV